MRLPIIAVAFLAMAAKPAPKSDKGVKAVEVSIKAKGEEIAFDKQAIEVPMGLVKLTFTNQAAKDSAIQHNIAVLKPGTTDEVIKALQASEYNLEAIRKHPSVLAMTKTLEPGTSGTLSFTPTAPGSYPYICLMPGHGDMLNMRGTLTVKP